MPSYLCLLIGPSGSVVASAGIVADDDAGAHAAAAPAMRDSRPSAEGYELWLGSTKIGAHGRVLVPRVRGTP